MTGLDEPPQRVGERRPVGIEDREVEEPRMAGRRRRAAAALPCVQADVVVIAARRDERRVLAHPLLQLEAEHADVEVERALDVRHLQVDVTDVGRGSISASPCGDRTASGSVKLISSSRPVSPFTFSARTGPTSRA